MDYIFETNARDVYDDSYPSPGLQWEWRKEDLMQRAKELEAGDLGIPSLYFMEMHFTESEYLYTPAELFSKLKDVEMAISKAEEKAMQATN